MSFPDGAPIMRIGTSENLIDYIGQAAVCQLTEGGAWEKALLCFARTKFQTELVLPGQLPRTIED